MCVIFLGKVKDILDLDLPSAWASNPHGAGILFHDRGGRVVCSKGLMTLEDTITAIESIDRNRKIAVHLRFATHGAINPSNTHPFPVGRGAFLMHNGILSAFGRHGDAGLSDSADLARVLGDVRDTKDRAKILRSVSGMFLYADRGGFYTFGSRSWIKIGKVSASNDNFLPRAPVFEIGGGRRGVSRHLGWNWGE